MNYFWKTFNLIFPKDSFPKKTFWDMLEKRILYYPHKQHIIFFPYKNAFIRKSIWSLKFKNNFSLAKTFGDIIYEQLPPILEQLTLSENFHNPIIITIPITFSKKMVRKYNQNDIIIRSFMSAGGSAFLHWEKNNLIKSRNTQAQSQIKNKVERMKNIKNSFTVKHPDRIKGRNILLFDDVITSGATIHEAKKVLQKAGAKKIICMALAH